MPDLSASDTREERRPLWGERTQDWGDPHSDSDGEAACPECLGVLGQCPVKRVSEPGARLRRLAARSAR
jgi:hypothetical protein